MGLDLHPAAAHGLEGLRLRELLQQALKVLSPDLRIAHVVLEREHRLDIVHEDRTFRKRNPDTSIVGDGEIHGHLVVLAPLFPQRISHDVTQGEVGFRPEILQHPGAVSDNFLEAGHPGLRFHQKHRHLGRGTVREMLSVRSDIIVLERAQGGVHVLGRDRHHTGPASVHRHPLPGHLRPFLRAGDKREKRQGN